MVISSERRRNQEDGSIVRVMNVGLCTGFGWSFSSHLQVFLFLGGAFTSLLARQTDRILFEMPLESGSLLVCYFIPLKGQSSIELSAEERQKFNHYTGI